MASKAGINRAGKLAFGAPSLHRCLPYTQGTPGSYPELASICSEYHIKVAKEPKTGYDCDTRCSFKAGDEMPFIIRHSEIAT